MVGQTSIQVLYWLKQKDAPSVSAIATALGKHRATVQTWLSKYRKQGIDLILEIQPSPGGVRVIPQGAEEALFQKITRI